MLASKKVNQLHSFSFMQDLRHSNWVSDGTVRILLPLHWHWHLASAFATGAICAHSAVQLGAFFEEFASARAGVEGEPCA